MKKRVTDLRVVSNARINEKHFLLGIAAEGCGEIVPGQFVEVLVRGSQDVFLRRPFSVCDTDPEAGIFYLLIKEVGPGSRLLGGLRPGETVNVMYPLGHGYTLPPSGPVLMIGGGYGIAPMRLLGRRLKAHGITADTLIGGRSASDILLADAFTDFGQVFMATEDGSLGHQGLLTTHPAIQVNGNPYTRFYACGPMGMLKAVSEIASTVKVDCEVSLENTMACGFGVCLSCITGTTTGNRCVCTDGPVFNSTELLWQTSV
ncbi:MAG TPA: dihydroorotate dehydrogenase electron transfer subunit [Bacteroidales bacterium]|nr:dihydroorotate dehydrogenase electron transfer subunit [Bacteroidales bacterium]HRZ77394.1 dihydroorotate dehydrogenase electron transfer subunit [Bacteroidales bacterium]